MSKQAIEDEPVSEISSLLAGLEASDLVEMIPLDFKQEKVDSEEPIDEEDDKLGDEPPVLNIAELAAKTMQLRHDSAQPKNVTTYAKTDWSCHKRASRTRLLVTHLHNTQLSQYELLYQLQKTSLVREIQIGFTNFWAGEESQTVPLSVFI